MRLLCVLVMLSGCESQPAGPTCGKNTRRDPTTNSCVVADSACSGGTHLVDGVCAAGSDGELLHSSPFALEFGSLYHMTAGALEPIGDIGGLSPGIGDDEATYLASGQPAGFVASVPAHWTPGAVSTTRTAIDRPITVGEWRACSGYWSVYRNQKRYRFVVELDGCPASTLYTLWLVYGRGPARDQRILGAPLGGVPQVLSVDADGHGRFSRDLDPAAWFQPGVTVGGINVEDASSGTAAVLDPAQVPEASIWIDLDFQNTGQSNGNAGFCEIDVSGNCVTPPSSNLYLPGQLSLVTAPMFTSAMGDVSMPAPLSMLQPF